MLDFYTASDRSTRQWWRLPLVVCHERAVDCASVAHILRQRETLEIGRNASPMGIDALVIVIEHIENAVLLCAQTCLQCQPPGIDKILSFINNDRIIGEIKPKLAGVDQYIGKLIFRDKLMIEHTVRHCLLRR